MAALPRDLTKPRAQRLSEVMQSIQQQAGQPNSQLIVFGCVLAVGGTASQLAISQGEYVLGQQIVELAAQTALAVPAGANPGAGLSVIVNVEGDSTGAVTLTPGSIAGVPVAPALTPAKILLGQLTIPGAFTPGTTSLTTGMLTSTPYSAGNVSPVGGF